MKKAILTGLVALVAGCSTPQKPRPVVEMEVSVQSVEPMQITLNPLEFPPIDMFIYKETPESYGQLKKLYVITKRFQIAVSGARSAGLDEPSYSLYSQLHDLHDEVGDHFRRAYCVKNNLTVKIDPRFEPAELRILESMARARPIGIREMDLYSPNAVHEFVDTARRYYDLRSESDLPRPRWLVDHCLILSNLFVSNGYWKEN